MNIPNCPRCGSNSQVWINQLSNVMTCHRIGCHLPIVTTIEPLTTEQEAFKDRVAQRIAIWKEADKRAAYTQPKKPSLLSRLFARVGTKYKGWGGPRED